MRQLLRRAGGARNCGAWLVLLGWLVSNGPGLFEIFRRLEVEQDPMSDAPVVERLAPHLDGFDEVAFFTDESRLRDVRRRYYAAQYALTPIAVRGPWVGNEGVARALERGALGPAAVCYCSSAAFRSQFELEMSRAIEAAGDEPLWRHEASWLAVRPRAGP